MFGNMSAWIIADASLAIVNLFNCFVIFCHLHPVASPLKRICVKHMHDVVKPVHSIPGLDSALLLMFFAVACKAGHSVYDGASQDIAMIVRAIAAGYTFTITSLLMKLSEALLKLGVEKMLDRERELEKIDIVKFKPPSIKALDILMAPMKSILRVDAVGLENIPPNTPHFFVMNHSLHGIEMPFFIHTLYKEKGIFARGLADHFHFATPNGPILTKMGAVDGTRENVDVLMESKQDVLVYPGGGHEVMKHSSVPRYELLWKERLGFARLAIKHGYPILPCAAVGTEDMLDTLMDIPLDFARKGLSCPVVMTHPGKVQKIYFWFGKPISTKQYKGDFSNDDFAREVRDKAKAAIEGGIKELQERQANDPERFLMDEYTAWLKKAFDSAYQTIFSFSPVSSFNSDAGNVPKIEDKSSNSTKKVD
mmetsp:Transcript_8695/g.15978  ORF Transcript_8695/g.15978 Transcript_8695/m.15978 type:complete len:423 (-) Transcript_8695:333-1601(-)